MARRLQMFYDPELSRWVVEGKNEWYSLHCGEIVQFHIERTTLSGRLELGRTSWYIISGDVAFGLLENRRYLVSVDL
ncbi:MULTISPECIES: DUF5348 domain-containing protein [Alicyclobacillus]|uniref:DUF5348 domain-containing protein n=1 Tax=Alicyclobacillus acidoterrestris (strain ATCC 49025 / DSM 3922 / CIP 106132 / NCIMB 13137 / GD3B) TaxID=1356854 RepID=A0A9E6ZIH2_ALIAG|nr:MULTISPECIES: DUF5348 domain-containing protein [Alicyclobacillus]UNO47776.1 DUF5348 domain-containing protein [Alicyclobacillus acidoterrestris]UNO48145.1 DUF5348 domain-containing protein [Alicyclobacillus acidoterrestris]UNO49046.1 DUF5348 domain-containing protein [Alicyclobacillus acidoterrestris]UNO49363.1 DUF5348 domain-containing protein [Alicyclobacillus acidoterrestris]UNO49371.1 DUF5348 domain-containing protein [Alicyclobacillus acidoterrestris]